MKLEPSWCACVCVLREFIRNAENTLALSKLANVSSFLVKNTYGLWFQLQWWEFFKNAENTFSESSAIIDNLFLWKHIIAVT